MTELSGMKSGSAREAAAAWVVRLSAAQAGEADWLAFEAWLGAAPENRRRYDEAMAVWLELDGAAEPGERRSARHGASPAPLWAGAAMTVLVLFALSAAIGLQLRPTVQRPATAYETARGERRALALADGSRIELAGDSRVLARLDGGRRDLTLVRGEAAFTIVHDPAHPFTLEVGDRQVRDLGTEFDVRRGADDVAVTVRRGLVQVAPAPGAAGPSVSLGEGRRLVHRDGEAGSRVEPAPADEAFAWTSGRLIYRNRPLGEVVEDLNRYLPQSIAIADPKVAELRFTGVLKVDAEASTLARLTLLLPVSATPDNGAIILRSRGDAR